MKDKKVKTIGLGMVLLILAALTIGVSYSYYQYNGIGTVENVIMVNKLKVLLDEKNELDIKDATPQFDEQAIHNDGFEFSLVNDEDFDFHYKIYIDNVDVSEPDVKLDDRYIKLSLEKDSVPGAVQTLELLGDNGDRLILEDDIPSHTTYSYSLKIWLRTDVDMDAKVVRNQVWKGKIRVEGQQNAH